MESPGEVDFLEFQRRVNTFLGMPFYVHSARKLGPNLGRMLTTFHQLFTEIIVIVVTVGQFWAIPHIYHDMNILCSCLSSGSHSAQVVVKITLLKRFKSLYLAHIDAAHSLQKESDRFERSILRREPSFGSYHRKQATYIKTIVAIQLLVNFVSTSAYFLPFVYDSIVNESEVKRQLTPIVVHVTDDINFTPLFQTVVITLTVGFYTINLKTVVIDNFLLSLIVLHMSQLKYHNRLLREIMETPEGGEDAFRAWVRQHQALTSLCHDFRKLISPYLFVEFSYVFIHTCVPSFVITSTVSWTLPQKVAVFCMVGGGLVEVFLMCSAGGVFSDVWQSTGDMLFLPEYFSKTQRRMKGAYMLIQKNSQRPFHLSALNFIPLNRGTFASILRLIFSYYMTLNQIQRIKHDN